jgi:hypothetical protein
MLTRHCHRKYYQTRLWITWISSLPPTEGAWNRAIGPTGQQPPERACAARKAMDRRARERRDFRQSRARNLALRRTDRESKSKARFLALLS